MAELVDALDSKSGYRKVVQVRFLFWAQRARVSAGLSVKEQHILTLTLKLTLFFLGVMEQHILTLKLKLTLFFLWV